MVITITPADLLNSINRHRGSAPEFKLNAISVATLLEELNCDIDVFWRCFEILKNENHFSAEKLGTEITLNFNQQSPDERDHESLAIGPIETGVTELENPAVTNEGEGADDSNFLPMNEMTVGEVIKHYEQLISKMDDEINALTGILKELESKRESKAEMLRCLQGLVKKQR